MLEWETADQTIHEELTTNQHLVSEVGLLAEPFEPRLAGERAADVGVQWTELESSFGSSV
ncbi:hypothetical protein DAPPUDRAFT_261694 [Daphnia pulex]|uniref:Uncharacterized protein n=1 Tax=Daphnia pulex TaxID=6669 RepID=E9HLG8_DAPPU|nr:hypothetical protein DAPPUDRAFT_261694 [Daphnia pulex]|eukprot:EFX67343.1 hypothetical protein DAPPUDRAFT_261694 [Daphnia pulex]